MSKSLTKLQIETAQEVLMNALRTKQTTVAKENYDKDVAKYAPSLTAFHKKCLELRAEAEKIKVVVEKNPKLHIDLDSYNCATCKLPEKGDDPMKSLSIQCTSNAYNDDLKGYYPDMKKQEEAVRQFILELKLGTALMSGLQVLLDDINKVK